MLPLLAGCAAAYDNEGQRFQTNHLILLLMFPSLGVHTALPIERRSSSLAASDTPLATESSHLTEYCAAMNALPSPPVLLSWQVNVATRGASH
jgi:hypothetical protein